MMNKKEVTIISTLVIIIIFIWSAFLSVGYPLLNGDTICFLPTAFEINNHRGLINHIYHPISEIDNRFLFYPPFYPWFFSLINPSTSVLSAHFSLYLVQVVSFLLMLYTLYKIYVRCIVNKLIDIKQNFNFILLTVIAASACFPSAYSRPESLCKLFLILTIFIVLSKFKYKLFLISTISFASILTSPVFGFYLLLLIAIYIAGSNKLSIKTFLALAIPFIFGTLLFMFFFPYQINDLLIGISKHSHNVVFNKNDNITLIGFIQNHLVSPDNFSGILVFVFSAYIAYYLILKEATFIVYNKLLCIAMFSFLICSIIYFSFRTIHMTYYMYVMTPFMVILLFCSITINRHLSIIAGALMLLFSFGFIRHVVIFVKNGPYNKEFSIKQVENKIITKYPLINEETVGFTPGLWPIFINNVNSDIIICNSSTVNTLNRKYKYLVVQQVYSNLRNPLIVPGYSLIEDHFSDKNVSLFKMKIASQPLAYQYAVYERE